MISPSRDPLQRDIRCNNRTKLTKLLNWILNIGNYTLFIWYAASWLMFLDKLILLYPATLKGSSSQIDFYLDDLKLMLILTLIITMLKWRVMIGPSRDSLQERDNRCNNITKLYNLSNWTPNIIIYTLFISSAIPSTPWLMFVDKYILFLLHLMVRLLN